MALYGACTQVIFRKSRQRIVGIQLFCISKLAKIILAYILEKALG